MTSSENDFAPKQKDRSDYPIIAIAIDNIAPRQNIIDVFYLKIVQLMQTSKQLDQT